MSEERIDEYKNIYEPIYREFEERNPCIADRVIDWYPSGQREITVRTDNGNKFSYTMIPSGLVKPLAYRGVEREPLSEQEWRIEFSTRLSRKMRLLGITSDTLSERTGISRVTISKYLNCKSTASGHNIDLIARACMCSTTELIGM
jgi:hypothetical protein